jgi:hypothetical protein
MRNFVGENTNKGEGITTDGTDKFWGWLHKKICDYPPIFNICIPYSPVEYHFSYIAYKTAL